MSDLALVVTSSFAPALSLVADSVRSPHTKRAYRSALTDFMRWCQTSGAAVFSKATVYGYRATLEKRNLSASSIKVQMSAIRRLAAEMADNGLLDPQIALVISRVSGPAVAASAWAIGCHFIKSRTCLLFRIPTP